MHCATVVVSAQSFTLWQQAIIEITRSLLSLPLVSAINCSLASQASLEVTHQDHSIGSTLLLLVRTTCMDIIICAHPVRGECDGFDASGCLHLH